MYVNQRAVDVPAGSMALAAVEMVDPELGAAIAEDRAYLTDGRGVRLPPDTALEAGAILRVVRPARPGRHAGKDDDAHA